MRGGVLTFCAAGHSMVALVTGTILRSEARFGICIRVGEQVGAVWPVRECVRVLGRLIKNWRR